MLGGWEVKKNPVNLVNPVKIFGALGLGFEQTILKVGCCWV